MPSLEAVWRAVFPAAHVHPAVARDSLQRQVAWVRVLKARVPAFDALDPDDLAILPRATLGSLAALAVEPATVVEAVAQARGSGVLVVSDGGQPDPLTTAVLDRAASLGLAGLLMPESDVASLERSAIAYILNGQAELERRVGALEAELEQVALAGGGPDGLAATISRFLSRPVAIESADGTALAVHAPIAGGEDAPVVGTYLRRRRGAALRLPLPAVGGDETARARTSGTLVLLGRRSLSDLERMATSRVVALVALEVARAQQAAAPADRQTDGLPAGGPPWVVLVARQIDATLPATPEERERLRDDLRRTEPARRLSLRGDAASVELRLVAAVSAEDPRGVTVARRVAARVGRPVAVSPPFTDRAERPIMEARARATLEAVEQLPQSERRQLSDRDGGIVAIHELAPAYRLLGALPALPEARRHAEALLTPLLIGSARRDAESLATLRAVLDHAGLAEAAAALGVHRNTLAYRLQRIEARTGWSLADPVLRMGLAIAVRIVQSAHITSPEAPARAV